METKDQYTICRFCGGKEKSNPIRNWSDNPTTVCYCTKFDLALHGDANTGKMHLANGHGDISCDGKELKI